MPDVENVIKGLKYLHDVKRWSPNESEESITARRNITWDALALLKAQEPVEPVVDIDTWKCGKCGHTLEHQELLGENVLFHEQYNYCPECGRAVKWDG